MKKILALMVCSILFFNYIFEVIPIQAASKTEYTVKVGKKITLKTSLKNAVWGSDNTSVATVTKKGVVKGVTVGSCTIVATANGKAELFPVSVTKKKSNSVAVYTDKTIYDNMYGYHIALKEYPNVYIDGKEFAYYTSTFSDLFSTLSQYNCPQIPGLNDIITDEFKVEVYNNDQYYASIIFKSTDSMIAKDALLANVEFGYSVPSNFYYFNKNFKLKSLPKFENFKDSNLFSDAIPWVYGDYNDYELYYEISDDIMESFPPKYAYCYRELYCKDDYYAHTLYFVFDATTHECVYITMKYRFWGD